MSAQVDVLAVMADARRVLQVAAEYYGMSAADDSADALTEAEAAVAALIAERDALREALEKLVEAADTSDECRYGTLATGFVRDIARAALATGESA